MARTEHWTKIEKLSVPTHVSVEVNDVECVVVAYDLFEAMLEHLGWEKDDE